jgi:tetratricopeptide (TPR) repeat protein
MSRTRTLIATGGTVLAISAGLLAVGTLGGSPNTKPEQPSNQVAAAPSNTLLKAITKAQLTLQSNPKDFATWAGLSLAYVQQAKVGGDTSLYVRAEGAAQRSLALNRSTNYLGFAALAAVKNGRHDFAGALVAARQGIKLNSYNSTLFGAEGDALTQLGRYAEASTAVDQMNRLLPGVPAFTRASYALELRGDVAGSRAALERARDDSNNPADIAFCEYYLAELDLHYGGGATLALAHYQAGLAQTPDDASLRAGRAKAEAALGMYDAAVADYRSSVTARPTPQTVLELGQLLQSHGDQAGADEQYALFRVEEKLYNQSGVGLDTEATLFEADHGSPTKAVQNAMKGWKIRPFVEMADAYGWALYATNDYAAALTWANRAFVSGWKTAPALYHRGMIQQALGNKPAAKADLTEALRLDPAFDILGAPRAKAALATL